MADLKSLDRTFARAVDTRTMPGIVAVAATDRGASIDRTKQACGVFLSQLLPFYDGTATSLFAGFETEVYGAL